MPDYILIFRLLARTFILKKKSLHYPAPKRILFVVLAGPLLTLLIFINQLFLLLDNLLFFSFRFIKVKKSAFIVGVPRSGTTYMYELLSRDNNFTCFKLWEIIFAPSIIQKLIAILIIKIDTLIGRPLFKLSRRFDKMVFGDFRNIHPLSLSLPEEDELLMVYDFSSLYFYYFFPEAKAIQPYLFFDDTLSDKKKKRIMKYYYRCVQRHQFVFNRKGEKYFLSKNPGFITKINSLNNTFDHCKILYMLRSPRKTIPSTISLNQHIFQVFSKVEYDLQRINESREIILKWYRISTEALDQVSAANKRIVLFKPFISKTTEELKEVYDLLDLNPLVFPNASQKKLMKERKNYVSKHNYDVAAGLENFNEKELLKKLNLLHLRDSI